MGRSLRLPDQVKQCRRIDGEHPELEAEMRALVPKDGDDYVKVLSVWVHPKQEIKAHTHPEHTVLYYVEPAGVPIHIGGSVHLPEKGEFLYLAPGTVHSVPKNTGTETRISIAMVVDV
jgi:quercetin dioxygenase-like cupin family protein